MTPLPKAMLADLKRSGLGVKDAKVLGLEHSEVEGCECYAIPYLGVDGKPTGHWRVRYIGAEEARPKDAKGKPMRYSQPKGSAPRFYLPHIGGLNWRKLAKDPRAALYITEGEKKAASLSARGIAAIGLGGVWNWRTSEDGGHVIDDFNRFQWKGRTVRIVFDSDAREKTDVQRALRALADELIKRGALPSSVDLPRVNGHAKTGVDDFIAHKGGGKGAIKLLRALPETPLLVPRGHTAAEIAAMKLPEPKWIVEGLLPVGLTVLAGKPKIGKSWLALDLILAVAIGGKVLGVHDAARGDALYLALEDTQHRMQSRLRRVLDGGAPPDRAHCHFHWPRVEQHGLTALRRWLDEHKATRLVVIDTLAKMRVAPSGKGSLYYEDYDAVSQLKTIADEYALALLVVHHTRKAASDDPLDMVSGSTGITGAGDTTLVLYRQRLQADASLFITGRDVQEQEIALSLDPKTRRWRALGDAAKYRMGQERKQILDALARIANPASATDVANELGRKRAGVQRLLTAMMHDGQVQWRPGGQYELKG